MEDSVHTAFCVDFFQASHMFTTEFSKNMFINSHVLSCKNRWPILVATTWGMAPSLPSELSLAMRGKKSIYSYSVSCFCFIPPKKIPTYLGKYLLTSPASFKCSKTNTIFGVADSNLPTPAACKAWTQKYAAPLIPKVSWGSSIWQFDFWPCVLRLPHLPRSSQYLCLVPS